MRHSQGFGRARLYLWATRYKPVTRGQRAIPEQLARLRERLHQEPMLAQGLHPDPAEVGPAPRGELPPDRLALLASHEMVMFRKGLLLPGNTDHRESVLADLARFTGLSNQECLERALGWEELSIQEWSASDRSSPDGIQQFYDQARSWCFDLLWYAYLQSEGYGYPASVRVARWLGDLTGVRHLDFGSGIGATSQLFLALGANSHLSDVSPVLLSFAASRLAVRGCEVGTTDLRTAEPPTGFDVVTAFDVLAHVPDITETAAVLARTVKPGGLLFANFDVRSSSPANAWHLYDDDLRLRSALSRAGFRELEVLDDVIRVYRLSTAPLALTERLRNEVRLGAPHQAVRAARHRVRSGLRRLVG